VPVSILSPSAVSRGRDRCPGALRVHEAADGSLLRLRVPGGRIDGATLAGIGDLAAEFGDGAMELTSRGNIQLRGIAPTKTSAVADRAADLGLLPSPRHELVRNIVASPLAGLDGSPDLDGLVERLDVALCARPVLADLPGRFLFGIDDGRGDIRGLAADVTIVMGMGMGMGAGTAGIAGASIAIPGLGDWSVGGSDPVDLALDVAEAFVAARVGQADAWRIGDLTGDGFVDRIENLLRDKGSKRLGVVESPAAKPPVGAVAQQDGGTAAAVLVPFGRLSATGATALASYITRRPARITPWRSIVIPDVTDLAELRETAVAQGFGFDVSSRWLQLSACIGAPGCASALADVRADAAQAPADSSGLRVHWSGCERRCGHPTGRYLDVVANADGYRVREVAG
jgi:precorrin-3B synthase